MTAPATPHLILVNLGTPAAPTPEAVRAFLEEFLGDPDVVDWPRWLWGPILRRIVLRRRPQRVAAMYASIWSEAGSPLRAATETIVSSVRARGAGRFGVSAAYRYGEPSLDAVMRRAARETAGPVIVTPLFPQRTGSTTGTALKRAREAAALAGIAGRVVERLIDPAEKGYVTAMAAAWRRTVSEAPDVPDHLVVSFHGIPVRYDRREGRRYVQDCEATTHALLAAIAWPAARATLAFQSKFGPERWLAPATAQVLAELPLRGVRSVGVITPGFLTDGLETVEEIGVRGRASFLRAGGEHFLRIGSVEREPSFIDSLCDLALA